MDYNSVPTECGEVCDIVYQTVILPDLDADLLRMFSPVSGQEFAGDRALLG